MNEGATRGWQASFVAAAVAVAALGFLPIANWIPGGHAAPGFGRLLDGWLSGSAICLGVGIVGAILLRGRSLPVPVPASEVAPDGIDAFSLGIAGVGLALYLAVALLVFDGRPLLIDEIVQVYQARIFASGRLWLPVPAHPEFTSSMHLIDMGRVYGQFPAGGPAMLAIGSLLHAEWLIGPLAGTVSVLAMARLLRQVEPRVFIRRTALVLYAFAPFVVFMSGSHMNHVTATMWIMLATTALFAALKEPGLKAGALLACGLSLGMAATIRPVDALAFAVPAAGWLGWRARAPDRRWRALGAFALGLAVPVLALGAVNWATTGAPLRFGYNVMWGREQGLGFHAAPWGGGHTPAAGLELLNLYFLRLQGFLLETPFPALLPVIAWLGFGRRHDAADRYFLVTSVLLCLLYAAYWHDGFYLGPRFLFPLTPALALYSARAFALWPRGEFLRRTLAIAYAVGIIIGITWLVPLRASEYRQRTVTVRWSPDEELRQAGITRGLVLVRESWGSSLMARMWARGIPRATAEHYYGTIDPCVLEVTLSRLERDGSDSLAALAVLEPLVADSARLVRTAESSDPTLRRLPGFPYGRACQERLADDRAGFTLFPPMLLARAPGVQFVRDLHARDSVMLAGHAGPIYLLKPGTDSVGALPRFYAVSPDSLWADWRRTP